MKYMHVMDAEPQENKRRCKWYKSFDFPHPITGCINPRLLKENKITCNVGVIDQEYRDICRGKAPPNCTGYFDKEKE